MLPSPTSADWTVSREVPCTSLALGSCSRACGFAGSWLHWRTYTSSTTPLDLHISKPCFCHQPHLSRTIGLPVVTEPGMNPSSSSQVATRPDRPSRSRLWWNGTPSFWICFRPAPMRKACRPSRRKFLITWLARIGNGQQTHSDNSPVLASDLLLNCSDLVHRPSLLNISILQFLFLPYSQPVLLVSRPQRNLLSLTFVCVRLVMMPRPQVGLARRTPPVLPPPLVAPVCLLCVFISLPLFVFPPMFAGCV